MRHCQRAPTLPCSSPHRSLGYCCIKQRDYPAALSAFTRCSQLDPDNGESWNNLAAVHMHLEHWPQAFNALTGAGRWALGGWGVVCRGV